eukprot:TRINITY_DN90747_c0_g1_i1.p1 TRINITY_DN90747_c0_g1~~TRINITY_DN90747_c0_g1_i1.p1  ORF type:complete len:283 (+),score=55.75 TRINITY_DN90747_c0_g1_i1:48-896(+)
MGVISHLKALLEDETDADVTIAAAAASMEGLEERRFHAIILKQVPYFATVFSSGFQEATTKRLVVKDVPARLLFPLLRALYLDEIENVNALELVDITDMMALCKRFQFPSFVVDCLTGQATLKLSWGKNIIRVLTEAYALDLTELQRSCLAKVVPTLAEGQAEFSSEVETPSVHSLQARMAVAGAMAEKIDEPDFADFRVAPKRFAVHVQPQQVFAPVLDMLLFDPAEVACAWDVTMTTAKQRHALVTFLLREKQATMQSMMQMMLGSQQMSEPSGKRARLS